MRSLLFITFFVAFFATGESLKCYECVNPPTAGCGESFDKKSTGVMEKTCIVGNACRKAVTKNGSEFYTTRGCGLDLGTLKNPQELRGSDMTEVYLCNTDLCNGSTSITAGLFTSLALGALSLFRIFY